jgi:hypothetical protein
MLKERVRVSKIGKISRETTRVRFASDLLVLPRVSWAQQHILSSNYLSLSQLEETK